MSKRILIVAHDPVLRNSRRALVQSAGYEVILAESDDLAILSVDNDRFDLVLIGRTSRLSTIALDKRLRNRYPDLLVLKIVAPEEEYSPYPSRVTDARPLDVLRALRGMLYN